MDFGCNPHRPAREAAHALGHQLGAYRVGSRGDRDIAGCQHCGASVLIFHGSERVSGAALTHRCPNHREA